MTIAKLRNLSKYGVVTDVDAFTLPPEAFTMGVNVRFKQGSVEPSPVFRRVTVTLAEDSPRFLGANYSTGGFDSIIIGYLNGRVSTFSTGAGEDDVSISGYVETDSVEQFTLCRLGDVLYVNRPDRVPWSLTVSDTDFQELANWDSDWRAKILRSCNSVLCAFGITKGATTYPTMVKTSAPATVNSVPASWDETDPTQNAYENILAEMEGGITDAQSLGQTMIVYGLRETWLMSPTSSNDVWNVRRLFRDAGCIGVNCSVEIDSKHYVFGPNDIWFHDGVSKQSICDSKVRKFIYRTMNLQKSGNFFVTYDEARKEIRFNYVGADANTEFTGYEGCNRSAVYYIPEGTWSFDDLPFVYGATLANVDATGLTYSGVSSTYDAMGGAYLDQEDGSKKTILMLSDVATSYGLTASIYALDDSGPDSSSAYPVTAAANGPRTFERDGIDLDELPEVEDLEGYKVVSSIFPQARFEEGAEPLMFTFGSATNYDQTPDFADAQSYDADEFFRCDFNQGGRFLYLRVTHDDYRWFKFTGLDADIYETGMR